MGFGCLGKQENGGDFSYGPNSAAGTVANREVLFREAKK